jgi:uncharacterized protein (DUF697 family)
MENQEAHQIIKKHVLISMGAGLIPIFVLDIIAITAVQTDMIRQLCRVYQVDYHEKQGKVLASALTGTTLGRLAGYTVGSILKIIPGIGTLLGGMALLVTAGGATYALGQVFARHFETGGSIFDLNPEQFKRFYQEQFEKGKDVAKKWKSEEESKQKSGGENSQLLNDLKEAEALKASGALTEEEFIRIKEEILRRYLGKE